MGFCQHGDSFPLGSKLGKLRNDQVKLRKNDLLKPFFEHQGRCGIVDVLGSEAEVDEFFVIG